MNAPGECMAKIAAAYGLADLPAGTVLSALRGGGVPVARAIGLGHKLQRAAMANDGAGFSQGFTQPLGLRFHGIRG